MDIYVQSFLNSATKLTISVNTTTTFAQLAELVFAAEGTTSTIQQFYINNIEADTSATMAFYSVTTGTYIGSSNTISTLATKEQRQLAKLNLAALKRKEAYDITKLPTRYVGNTSTDNVGILELRRPWIIDYSRVMEGMVLWLDAADTDSYLGTGTTWTDLAGTANNFTLFNTPTWNSAGYFDFDPASSEYAAITHTATLKPTAAITIEQWLNADDWSAGTEGGAFFTSLSCTQGGGYAHYIWDSTFVPYVYVTSLSNYLKPTASIAGFTGWHHFATTFDGRYAKLYIDGDLKNTVDAGSSTTIGYDPDNDICIGTEAGTASTPAGSYWDGKIATTAIYNRALTAAEVLKNYNSDRSRFGV